MRGLLTVLLWIPCASLLLSVVDSVSVLEANNGGNDNVDKDITFAVENKEAQVKFITKQNSVESWSFDVDTDDAMLKLNSGNNVRMRADMLYFSVLVNFWNVYTL